MKLTHAVIAALIVLGVITFSWFEIELLNYQYDYEETEGDHLNYAILLSQGISPYNDNNEFPMLFILYPPAYHLAMAVLFPMLGHSLLAGRLISLLCFIGIVYLIFEFTNRITKNRSLAIITALSFVCAKIMVLSLVIGRVNTMFVFFSLLGYYLIYRSDSTKSLTLATLCFFIAMYTKQTALLLILPAYAYLFYKHWRRALPQFILFGLLCLLSLILLEIFSGGWFLQNIMEIPAGQSSYHWKYILSMFFFLGVLLFPVHLLALKEISKVNPRKIQKENLPLIFLVGGILIILLFGWNSGASADYMAAAWIGALIVGAQGYSRIKIKTIAEMAVILILLVQIGFLSSGFTYHSPGDPTEGARAVEDVSQIDGPLLTDRMATISILAEKEVHIESSVVSLLYDSEVWDASVLEDSIKDKQFSAIFARVGNAMNSEVITLLVEENYELTETYILTTRGDVQTEYGLFIKKNV